MGSEKKQSFELKKKGYLKPRLIQYDDLLKATKGGINPDSTEDDGASFPILEGQS